MIVGAAETASCQLPAHIKSNGTRINLGHKGTTLSFMQAGWVRRKCYGFLSLFWPDLPFALPPPELEGAGAWERVTGAAAAGAEWDGAETEGCDRTGSGRETGARERGAAS